MQPDLTTPSKLFRAPVARGLAAGDDDRVVRDGGMFGAGLIRGVAVITLGEARGHDRWIDRTFMDQIRTAINASDKGLKSRFQHPTMSGDGTGKYLGRFRDARLVDDKVVADLHLADAARRTPDGDLASYVTDLADEDPEAFGTSISFEADREAETQFQSTHRDAEGRFHSPDPANEKHYPHVRLARLRANDVVDSPAANPDGLFHRNTVAHEAEAVFDYALGRSDEAPAITQFDIEPDRVRGFVQRYLDQHNLEIKQKGNAMSNEQNKEQTAEQASQVESPATEQTEGGSGEAEMSSETQPEPAAEPQGAGDDAADTDLSSGEQPEQAGDEAELPEGQRFLKAFGDRGGVWFAEGLTFEQAHAKYAEELKAENEALKSRLAASDRGVDEAVEFQAEPEPTQPKGLKSMVKIRQK